MNESNPYAPPRSEGPEAPAAPEYWDDAEVPREILRLLGETRPWMKFLAVVGFVLTALMLVAGLFIMIGGQTSRLPGAFGIIYIVLVAVYLIPSYLLHQCSSSIQRAQKSRDMHGLADVLQQQKSLWKTIGWMAILTIVGYILLFAAGVFRGVSGQ